MQRFASFTASIVLLAFACPGFTQERVRQPPDQPAPKVKVAVPAPASAAADQNPEDRRTFARRPSPEEEAIRETAKKYIAAFSGGDAKAAVAIYTDDAEYIDPQGNTYQGRQAIEDLLAAFFKNYPERKLDLLIDSIRIVSPTVAIEDGVSIVATSKDTPPQSFQYTAVHVKSDGHWQTASVRDRVLNTPRQHRAQLTQLDWLVGDWVHEGDDALVHFSCHPVDNGHFLARKFTVQVAGQHTMTGIQRIGWDPHAGKFRAWVFDSDGGFSEGYWRHDGDAWILKLTGVTPDGQSASCTSIYTFVDGRTMTFRSVHHEVGGIELPDSAPVTIVRQPPQIETTAQ